jgi:hypothetical protein
MGDGDDDDDDDDDDDEDDDYDPAFAPMGGSANANPPPPLDRCDIDVLLENSTCERFVLRCVENELPPNLIHCLRLLRVLELQHDHAYAVQRRQMEVEGDDYFKPGGGGGDGAAVVLAPGPASRRAASRVSDLLRLLCADSSVGEQLRPHLFGLLALSGASYPPSGVHIACAASEVIGAFSAHCLSPSLVWFLHDRKMIVHMTDDVKELCAMTAGPAGPAGGGGGGGEGEGRGPRGGGSGGGGGGGAAPPRPPTTAIITT